MGNALADLLQVWGFEEDLIIFSDGSIGFGLDATPLDVSCWGDEDVNGLATRIGQFLNGLPAGVDIQFAQQISPGNADLIKTHAELGKESNSPTALALCEQRVSRLGALEKNGSIPKHGLKIFVRKPFADGIKKPRFFSKPGHFQPVSEQKLQAECAAATRLRDDVVQGLKALGIEATAITPDGIAELLYQQWNPSRDVALGEYDPTDIRTSLLFTDVTVSETGFSLSDVFFRVISLKILPEETFASMARHLRELPFNSTCFLTIHVPDQHKELTSLQTQRRVAFSMARGKREGVSDIESESKLTDLETLLEQMISSGEKVFHVSLNVLLRAPSREELDEQVSLTLMKLRELSGTEGMEESLAAFDIFSEFAFPNARAKERAKRIKTSNLSDLLPLFGAWAGHDRPSILLRSRLGSLVSFDPFASELPNANHIVSGGSGSGKSFLTNILLLQMLKENPNIFIIDIGGSYKKLCENLSGQYIPLGVDLGISINPFDLPPGETVPSSHKIKFLLGLVELMTKEDEATHLPRLERAELEEAIQKVYEKPQAPSLSDLRESLLTHANADLRRYGKILTTWCGDTPFGRFVDRPTTISLERPLVAFDLKGMESYPDLQAIALFLITDFVWSQILKDRSTKKFVIFDECWRLLESDDGVGAAFIGELYRTCRKCLAGCIGISQNVDDFAKSKVAAAILSNSATKWILMQGGADQARLQEVLQLNDNEMALIASLHQERGLYSEAFLISQHRRSVVVVESTPLEYWIATTDPKDLAAFDAASAENPTTVPLEMLRVLSEKYPCGVAAGN